MLEEYKELYRRSADIIPNWQEMNKNDLCYKYLENEGNNYLQNAYFSALVFRYWNLIPKYYYQSSNVASFEDCYNWLLDSITYALKHRRWEDPDSSIYNDYNGPDKMINRYMKCARLTFYQYINRKKRKDNFGIVSLEELLNTPEDIEYSDNINIQSLDLRNLIRRIYMQKDYFLAFMIDLIIYKDTFNQDEYGIKSFNSKKLMKFFRQINQDYCNEFATRYDLPADQVYQYYEQYVKNTSSRIMYNKIEYNLLKLKHDSYFKNRGT